MSELKVLSVASEIFPLVKTGGLADVSARCRRRLPREGVEISTLVPGYPAVLGKLADARRRTQYRRSVRRPGASPRRATRPASTCSRSTRRISSTGRAIPTLAPTARLARQRAPLRGARAGRRGHRARRDRRVPARKSCTRMTGRRRSRRVYLHYADRPRPGIADHDPQPRLPGPFPALDLRRAGLARRGAHDRRGRIFRRRRLSEGGAAARRPHHHRLADLRAGDHDARVRHGARRLVARRAAVVEGIVNGIDDTVWNPATDAALAQNYSALRIDMRVRNKTALQTQMGLAGGSTPPLFGVISPPTRTRRVSICCSRRLPGSCRQGRPARAARLGRAVAGGRLHRRRGRSPGLGRLRARL